MSKLLYLFHHIKWTTILFFITWGLHVLIGVPPKFLGGSLQIFMIIYGPVLLYWLYLKKTETQEEFLTGYQRIIHYSLLITVLSCLMKILNHLDESAVVIIKLLFQIPGMMLAAVLVYFGTYLTKVDVTKPLEPSDFLFRIQFASFKNCFRCLVTAFLVIVTIWIGFVVYEMNRPKKILTEDELKKMEKEVQTQLNKSQK